MTKFDILNDLAECWLTNDYGLIFSLNKQSHFKKPFLLVFIHIRLILIWFFFLISTFQIETFLGAVRN